MKADYPVMLDACVLAEAAVSDLFLRLSEEPRLLIPRWTEDIWTEARRTMVERLGWPPEIAESRYSAAKAWFPDAMVQNYEGFIPLCQNHPADRHVLAAAIRSQTETIITFNGKDFQQDALGPWGIVAVHPSDYLIVLHELDSAAVVSSIHQMAAKARRNLPEMLARLAWHVPTFSKHVAESLEMDLPEIKPLDWRR